MKKIYIQKVFVFLVVLTLIFGLTASARATTIPTFSASTGNSGYMMLNISGEANSLIKLTFYPFGLTNATTIDLGTTDANGNYVGSISTNVYNIITGTSAYVTVNGMQSASITWPAFGSGSNNSNSLSLNQYTANLSVGQSIVIYSANASLYSVNSNSAVVSATISNGQATLTGAAAGSATVTVCSTSGNCNAVTVTVQAHGSPLSLNQSYATIAVGQGIRIISANSAITSANSNSSAAKAYVNNDQVTIIGLSYGTATIAVCNASNVCDSIYITVQNPSGNTIVLNQNVVEVGLNESVVVYSLNGTIDTVSSNAPKATAYLNSGSGNNKITITGIEGGVETLTVCGSGRGCNVVLVTVKDSATINNLSLTQRVVLLTVGQSTIVTSVSSTIVTATSDSSNASTSVIYGQLTITGKSAGTAVVTACNSVNVCDKVYITVQNPTITSTIVLNQRTAALTIGQSITVTSANNNIYSGSSNSVKASVVVANNQATITGAAVGLATITLCNSGGSCDTVQVTVSAPTTPTTPVITPNTPTVFTRLLTLGSSGADVRALQNLLIKAGFLKASSTGYFGAQTQKALRLYQAKHKIAAVGYTGPSTRVALNAEAGQ